jgi:glutamyl-tRNA reductase
LVQADVLLACTGSPELLVAASDVSEVLDRRRGRPLLVVDLAVPRDVDPAVGALPGVTVLDMDELAAFASRGMASRRREVPRAEQIVAEEIGRYSDLSAQRHVAPLIGALHERAEEIREGEMARFQRRLAGLDESSARAVEALTRGIVAKLLHDPTVAVKSGVGTPTGEQLAQALRQLFDL